MNTKWFVAVVAIYLAVLKYIFPGYIRPLSPHHNDFYMPPGLAFDGFSFWQHLRFPRPAGFLAMEGLGLLGLKGWMLAVVVIALLAVFAAIRLVERLAERPVYPLWGALYVVLVFAHPGFYMDYLHDAMGTASLLYLLLAMHAWLSFKKTGRNAYLALCVALFLVASLTKETYFLSGVVFWGMEVLRNDGRWRKMALLAVAALCGSCFVGLLANMLSVNPFIRASTDASSPYHISLAVDSVLRCYWIFLRALFTPIGFGIVALALASLWRNRPALLSSATLLCAGLVALLPNSVLPNHIDPMYAWAGACLAFSPVLFCDWRPSLRRWPQAVAAVLVAGALGYGAVRANRPQYERWQWTLDQERINNNFVRSFARLKQIAARRVLITGVNAPYHPWAEPPFVRAEFGPGRAWTVIVPRERSARSVAPVTYANSADVAAFDYAFGYGADGRLLHEWNAEELKRLAAQGEGDRVLQPALIQPLDALAKEPGNWFYLMRVGVAYLEWGRLDQAENYLTKSCAQNTTRNAYPPFFLGKVKEAQGQSAEAARLYRQAMAMDAEPRNPAFAEALARIEAKPRR